MHYVTLVGIVARKALFAPATLAALVARGDVDLYSVDGLGAAPILGVLRNHTLQAFLAAFPAFDVNAPCRTGGCTPLGYEIFCACQFEDFDTTQAQMLLDAGADVREGMCRLERYCCSKVASLLAPHIAWAGCRQAWVAACVALSTGIAKTADTSFLAFQMDAMRSDVHQFQIANEYASMVATFL